MDASPDRACDGSTTAETSTQDLGTAQRTVTAIVTGLAVPVTSPLQPVKVEPASGVAVRVTGVPPLKFW